MVIEKIDLNSLKIIDVKDYVQNYKVKFKNHSEEELNYGFTIFLLHKVREILAHNAEVESHIFTYNTSWGNTCEGRILKDAFFDGRVVINGHRFESKDTFFINGLSVYYVKYSELPIMCGMLLYGRNMVRKILLKNMLIKLNKL